MKLKQKLCNLLLIPNSHKETNKYEYDLIKTNNGIKPAIKENFVNEILMVKNKNGRPLIFNMNLIHGGTINQSRNCRVSINLNFLLQFKNIPIY